MHSLQLSRFLYINLRNHSNYSAVISRVISFISFSFLVMHNSYMLCLHLFIHLSKTLILSPDHFMKKRRHEISNIVRLLILMIKFLIFNLVGRLILRIFNGFFCSFPLHWGVHKDPGLFASISQASIYDYEVIQSFYFRD